MDQGEAGQREQFIFLIMKFKAAPDNQLFCLSNFVVSENNLVYIGVYPVIFGYRVRAGFVDDLTTCRLDWCAGGVWEDVERLYSLCYSILENRDENTSCFDEIPAYSERKPFYNDLKFVTTLNKHLSDVTLLKLNKPN